MKIKKTLKDFVNSFKPNIIWLYIMMFDLLFYGISVLLIKSVGSYLSEKSAAINLPVRDIAAMSAEQLKPLASHLQNFFIAIILLVILSFIIIMAAWSLTRGLIYSALLKKKFTKAYFKKFFLLNLFLTMPLAIILVFFTAIGLVLQGIFYHYKYVYYLVILAVSYYLAINYISFTKKNKVFDSIAKSLEFGIKKLHKLLLPCLLILIVSIMLPAVISLIPIPLTAMPLISLIAFVLFMAWARIYFIQEAEKVKS
jgi:hypothetical protein